MTSKRDRSPWASESTPMSSSGTPTASNASGTRQAGRANLGDRRLGQGARPDVRIVDDLEPPPPGTRPHGVRARLEAVGDGRGERDHDTLRLIVAREGQTFGRDG